MYYTQSTSRMNLHTFSMQSIPQCIVKKMQSLTKQEANITAYIVGIIYIKFETNPSIESRDNWDKTWLNGQNVRQTDRQTDRQNKLWINRHSDSTCNYACIVIRE